MKNLIIASCLLPMTLWAQTDVTSQYLANPSFEEVGTLTGKVTESSDGLRGWAMDPQGWTVAAKPDKSYIINAECFTDNGFGKTDIADGLYAFYQRNGWSAASGSLRQVTKAVPAGRYKLTVDSKAFHASGTVSATLTVSNGGQALGAASFASSKGSADIMGATQWDTQSVEFSVEAETALTITADMTWTSGGAQIALDNFRLISLPEDYKEETIVGGTEDEVSSYTEGVITHDFVAEPQMKDDLLQMLANFAKYMKDDFQDCVAPNSVGEVCGCFKGENTMANDERGVRPNADMSMICAFLVKYGKDKVTLPDGVTWEDIETIAMKSLVFAYSTHKANKLKVCSGNNYWGSTSTGDAVWESSLWAMSVAYSAFFQWDKLTAEQKGYIESMMVAECNYELGRSIPTGYNGDTKAEENGWEADILAATLGLFPNHANADKWFKRLREFAINSYSHYSDADNTTVIDPGYDNTTVADLYKGKNLYDDYTLQNHNLFHTSYQNVVMQELGEAALALKMFQLGLHGEEKWKTNALMHHNKEVHEEVLNWLALADGELAMPNGNDWSLFLFDQITSYSTMACFAEDKDALFLENMAYKYIKARQQTTDDGSWLLRADVGARRMGVEGHRVMMTWLMHEMLPTAAITPSTWDEFSARYSDAKLFKSQNIVRASSADRFVCFSWSTGLGSYTGYIASTRPDVNKIVVPFRANNTGNFLGWYNVSGQKADASPVLSGSYNLDGNAFGMNGALNTNGSTLRNDFAIIATPGNAVVYLDRVKALANATITNERGGLMAVSNDDFTRPLRTLYHAGGRIQTDGTKMVETTGQWVNIDNQLGFVTNRPDGKMGFGDRANNNSILTSKLYTLYGNQTRNVTAGEHVDSRVVVYYTNVTNEQTAALASELITLEAGDGYVAVIVAEPDGTHYLCAANLGTSEPLKVQNSTADIVCYIDANRSAWAPVEMVNGKWTYIAQEPTAKDWTDGGRLSDLTSEYIQNPSFEEDKSWSTTGNITLNSVTYNPCYTQEEPAIDASFPQVLAVKGWTPVSTLGTSSNFALRYSMPYSNDIYCVSPSSLGNSTSIKGAPLANMGECGDRCLSVLNSWTSGTNAIQQTVKLPAGEYILTYVMTYTCANEESHNGNVVTAGGNVNTSLCGLSIDGGQDIFWLPETAETWAENAIPFTLGEETEVTISMGLNTTKGVGAANNTRLYIDNVRLYGKKDMADGIQTPTPSAPHEYYDLQGRRVATPAQHGIYISAGSKVVVK